MASNAPDDGIAKYRRAKTAGKLTPFESKLLLALETDAHRPKRDQRTTLMCSMQYRNKVSTAAIPSLLTSSVTGVTIRYHGHGKMRVSAAQV